MEKIGSPSDTVLLANALSWDARHNLEDSKDFQDYKHALTITYKALREVESFKDIDILIGTENALVKQEFKIHEHVDKSVVSSLNAAKEDFSVMEKALDSVRSTEYSKTANSYHSKRKTNGVPTDGFHEAINGHITRLSNRLRAVGISVPEKNVLRQRQHNMRTAKELYIALQRKALGIEAPKVNKSKGLSR